MRCHPEILPDVAIDHVRSCCGRHAVQTVKQYNHIHEFHEYQQSTTISPVVAFATPLPLP
jgi:hypothetical protein